jgi:FixJ family two-component response regulator
MTHPTTVAIVDDDEDVRTALSSLLGSAGFRPLAFASAEAYLDHDREAVSCLVVDVRLPGISGIELVRKLAAADEFVTTVLITGQDDEATRTLLKATPLPCLRKPFVGDLLLATLDMLEVR